MHVITQKKNLGSKREIPPFKRLITRIFFESQKIFIQEIVTHAEYDKRNFKKQ
jgi:hypothetical protein